MTTAAAPSLVLPIVLHSHEEALVEALATPLLAEWDDEESYVKAPQPKAIGDVLVDALHDELTDARIGYVFRKKLSDRDKTRLAQASRVGGKLNFFSGLDLLIEVSYEAWKLLSPARRIALIDHELCHFSRDEDEEGNTVYKLLSHDVEEFGAIVRRWGLWKPDLERFGHAVENARQLGLFGEPENGEGRD